jgi:hypothetical protein
MIRSLGRVVARFASTTGLEHHSRRDNLADMVRENGVGPLDLPDPINLFKDTWPDDDGGAVALPGSAEAGGCTERRALADCIAACLPARTILPSPATSSKEPVPTRSGSRSDGAKANTESWPGR